MHRSTIYVPFALLILPISILACQGATTSKPTVIISSPPSGSTFNSGDDVPVQSTSTDPQGITRVELQVDGIVVRSDPSPVAQGQAQFSLIQTWKAAGAGSHNLTVRAYNTAGSFSDGGVLITVKEIVAAAPTDTPVIATIVPPPTSAPPATSMPPTSAPAPTNTSTEAALAPTNTATTPPCVPNSQFVADVTIPDGTILLPGVPFVKTWRVKNTGNCTWDNGYAVAFVGGTAFVQGAVPIPNAAPGQIVDISMAMVAPTSFGNYTGIWRLRGSNGVFFGTNLTTVISVPNPNPPTPTKTTVPSPTVTQTPPPCSGTPNDFTFGAAPNPIIKGNSTTLNWSAITNATSAAIDNGVGSIGTPGSTIVSPASTTTYTLTATCAASGQTRIHQVTVTVLQHWSHPVQLVDNRQIYHLRLTKAGAINVNATWTGTQGSLALIINGPGQTGYYARQDGTSPRSVSYVVTASDFAAGDEWRVSIASFGTGRADGSVSISYPGGEGSMVFNDSFVVEPGYGASTSVLVLKGAGTVSASATWTGTPASLALILNGPGQIGYYARKDGASPLSLSYAVTNADFGAGPTWRLSLDSFTAPSASGTLDITYP